MQPPPTAALPLERLDHERLRTQHELFERARAALPRDPFPHYLAHVRLMHGGKPLDVLFTSEPVGERGAAPEAGLLLAHYATSAFAEVLFSKREGETYELASSAGRVQGTLLESNIVSFRDAELALLIAPERRLFRDADGQWWRAERSPARLVPRPDAAREHTPSLIDVELDPAQRHVVELPAGTSVLVLGEAGHGKTTVALHRLAELERRARREAPERPFRAAVILPTEGLRRLIEPLLVKLGLEVEVRVYETWARAQAERAFPDLPERESQSASAGVIRLKRDPALRRALLEVARTRPLTAPRKQPQKPSRRRSKPLARRRDLLHLFGDKPLLEGVMHASSQRLGRHILSEILEHTHIQFSRPSEQEHAHVDAQRLRTVDGLPIDAGTPLEDAGSVDAEDYAVLFELDRVRANNAGVPALEPERYDCIVLDEAQEFAPLELALIGRSSSTSGSLIVAGDADQQTDPNACFTSWEESMRELGRPSYERAVLPVSYRCPASVVA
ncbi:MAG TPA: AAA family ATPase, partial [Polyangiaceae bacterium]|nr:AAA family ATPase [Polyangiaceae bacterium]